MSTLTLGDDQCSFCLRTFSDPDYMLSCGCGCGETFCHPGICAKSAAHLVICDACPGRVRIIAGHEVLIDGYPHCAACKDDCQRWSEQEKGPHTTAA